MLTYAAIGAFKLLIASILYSFLLILLRLTKSNLFSCLPVKTNKQCLLFTLITAIVLLAIWYTHGTHTSFDFGVRQMGQIHSGIYEKAHPVFHTILSGLLLNMYDSLHTLVAAQLIYFTCASFCIFWWCKREQLSAIYAFLAVAAIIYFTFPCIHEVIKDSYVISSYTIAAVGLMAWLRHPDKISATLATVGLVGVGSFRYDGQAIIVMVTVALLLGAYRNKKNLKQVYAICFIPIAAIIAAHAILPACVNAKSEMVGTKLAMPAELICEVIAQNGNISEQELAEAEALIMPKELILTQHSKGEVFEGQKYIWGGYFESDDVCYRYSFAWNLGGKEKELLPLFARIAVKNPGIILSHLFQQGKMVWDVRGGIQSPIALCFYTAALFLAFLGSRKLGAAYLIPFVPIFTTAAICTFVATTYEMRYGMPIIIGGILIIGYAHSFVRTPTKQKQ